MTQPLWMQPTTGPAAQLGAGLSATIPVIETERLRLRGPVHADFAAFAAILVPDDDGLLGGPFTEVEAWNEYSMAVGRWVLRGTGLFAVELHDGTLIGFCGVDMEEGDPANELGYLFLPAFHGQGYATEAAQAARDFAHHQLGLRRLISCVANGNARSAHLARKLGAAPAPEFATPEYDGVTIFRHPDPEEAA